MYKNSIIVGKTTRTKRGALMSTINKNSNIPLYVQLMNILIEKIESSMEENEKLDSEREICKKYAVSRTTVREALDELEKNNYIYKVQGKGNFHFAKSCRTRFNKGIIFYRGNEKTWKKSDF